jgi:tRNA-uridine 2-sulfurtransferase
LIVTRKARALGLCSGGLDSILSALVLKNQGIEVEWVVFETPFFSSEKAVKAARQIDVSIKVKRITSVYMKMLKNPAAGYGKYMNPCMDCHSLMFRLAGEIMETEGFDFLFSGEVLGQRPMSQTASSMRYVEKHSGYSGLILRPLSAAHLPETLPEKEGKVDRSQLLDLKGRTRKPQIELAKKYGINQYPAPGGGCLLTDKGFSIRLKDLFSFRPNHSERDLELLKHGRHIRLSPEAKIIVGRTREDNENLVRLYSHEKDFLLKLASSPGPAVLIPGGGTRETAIKAGAICAGYGKVPQGREIKVSMTTSRGEEILMVYAIMPAEIADLML